MRAMAIDTHGGVDAVLDLVGGEALAGSPALLRDGGRLASVIDPGKVKELGARYVVVRPDGTALRTLAEAVDDGRLRVIAQEVLPLADPARAHKLVERGHVRGKVILDAGPLR